MWVHKPRFARWRNYSRTKEDQKRIFEDVDGEEEIDVDGTGGNIVR